MSKKPTEEDIKKIAAQLRKPDGEHGIEVGKMMNDGNMPMNLHTIAVLNPQPNEQILEIGMGNGFFVKNILGVDPSIQYTGCDYSDLMVQESTRINQSFVDAGRAEFVHGNVQELPFSDHQFDKIFTVNTFYFWDDHVRVLKELSRVLKPQGSFVLSIRPKHILEQYAVTQHNFAIMDNEEIISLLQQEGFSTIEQTKVVAPSQERWGNVFARESLILNCSR